MNNSINILTKIFFNEILYDFKILKIIDFLNNDLTKIQIDDGNSVIIIKKTFQMTKKNRKIDFFCANNNEIALWFKA